MANTLYDQILAGQEAGAAKHGTAEAFDVSFDKVLADVLQLPTVSRIPTPPLHLCADEVAKPSEPPL
jgi:hypothetical protein